MQIFIVMNYLMYNGRKKKDLKANYKNKKIKRI